MRSLHQAGDYLRRAVQLALPDGVRRAQDYRRRFAALGLDSRFWRDSGKRAALNATCVELFPREARLNPGVIVDVGANRGEWTRGIAALLGGNHFFAYEPNPAVYRELEETTKHLPITLRQAAVGAAPGSVTLQVEGVHQLSSVLPLRHELREIHDSPIERLQLKEVPLVTLDEELEAVSEIGILKLDVQGYEQQVLRGARSVLRRTRVLMIEMLYRSYYIGDLTFEGLHAEVKQTSDLALHVVGPPQCDPAGQPLWADVIYVNSQLCR